MKTSIITKLLLAAPLFLTIACGPSEQEIAATAKADSLELILQNKDSIINATFSDIESIATTLNEIAVRESLVVESSASGEINKTQKAQIIDNIASINELLEQNKKTVSQLNLNAQKLRSANVKIEALESLIKQLEEQLAGKDQEIEALIAKVEQLNIVAADLQNRVAELEDERTELIDEAVFSDSKANEVYYLVGNEREMIKDGTIEKKGLFTVKRTIKNTDDLSKFTKADQRQLGRVKIGGEKQAKLVSSHPEGSYEFVRGAKNAYEELIIIDKDAFWRNSRILVISCK